MNDIRDWAILTIVTAAWIASTIFLFMYPTGGNFAVWAGLGATMVSAYHFLAIRDDKTKDQK